MQNELFIYRLQGFDPFLNLSVEDYLFRQKRKQPCLLLWQNDPCVVIGRGQNPWAECDLAYLARHDHPLIRRQTGGGTVYHDRGNLNISLITPGPLLQRNTLMTLLSNTFLSLGILNSDFTVTARGDIKIKGHKIVGSAYRMTQHACLHHVSLLFNSELNALRQALDTHHLNIQGKSVASVKSSVTTLQQEYQNLTLDTVINAMHHQFSQQNRESSTIVPLSTQTWCNEITSIQACVEEYKSWAWCFGKTPLFCEILSNTEMKKHIAITVEKGCIQSFESNGLTSVQKTILEKSIGKWYDQLYFHQWMLT